MWFKEVNLMDELEKAHKDYERRRIENINHLQTIADIYGGNISPTVIKWLKQAIKFIKEKEI